MGTQGSKASSLELSGHYLQALHCLRHDIRVGRACDAELWHTVGRLHQRLTNYPQASRAYATALLMDPHRPRSCNNLALLELGRLNADQAERWVLQGLACQPLLLEDEELLQATACDLRLFQLRPGHALQHVEQGEVVGEPLLRQLRKRELVVQLPHGPVNAEGNGESGWPLNREHLRKLLKEADGLLPNSWLELQALRNDLQWDGDLFEIAHYGVDPSVFLNADPQLFRQHTGINEPFVMQAGRIEPGKNQAMLCWALRHTNMPIVLIGGSKHWPSYAELCRKISGSQLTIIDHVPQNLLASAYAGAAVHCLPSWMETCGLVSLEAALSGTPLVGSTFGHELEYLEGDAWYADPGNADSLKKAVIAAKNAGRQHRRPIAMKRKVLERFNWERTVDATERLYRRVLTQHS